VAKILRNLNELSDGEMVDVLSQAVRGVMGAASMDPMTKISMSSPGSNVLKLRLGQYIGMVKAMHLWYHGAHHVTRGASFMADHPSLFGELYNALGDDYDAAVEKAIGVTNDENMGCPVINATRALQVMKNYPSPVKLTSLAMASTALQLEQDLIELVGAVFSELESSGAMSLGVNDFLMAAANDHESHVYKLQQRIKTELED